MSAEKGKREFLEKAIDLLGRIVEYAEEAISAEHGSAASNLPAPPSEAPPTMPPEPAPNPAWKWLSAKEQALLAAATNRWRPAKALVKDAGLTISDGAVYTLLGNLVERGILESSEEGYRVNRKQPEAGTEDASEEEVDKEGG